MIFSETPKRIQNKFHLWIVSDTRRMMILKWVIKSDARYLPYLVEKNVYAIVRLNNFHSKRHFSRACGCLMFRQIESGFNISFDEFKLF